MTGIIPAELRAAYGLHRAGMTLTWNCIEEMPAMLRDDLMQFRADYVPRRTA